MATGHTSIYLLCDLGESVMKVKDTCLYDRLLCYPGKGILHVQATFLFHNV